MGIFSRRKKAKRDGGDSRAEWVRLLESTAEEWWPQVPQEFPDGTPFAAKEAYDAVTRLGVKVAFSGLPNAAEISGYCLKVLACFSALAKSNTYDVSFALEGKIARDMLIAAGMNEEERTLSKALVLQLDYHEAAGHQPRNDIQQT